MRGRVHCYCLGCYAPLSNPKFDKERLLMPFGAMVKWTCCGCGSTEMRARVAVDADPHFQWCTEESCQGEKLLAHLKDKEIRNDV